MSMDLLDQNHPSNVVTRFSPRRLLVIAVLWIGLFAAIGQPSAVLAEPYLAVRSGLKCIACHVNPSGGGKRTLVGTIYGRNQLAAQKLLKADHVSVGKINEYLSFGGDLRMNLQSERIPNQGSSVAFELDETLLYFQAELIPNRLSFYFDERLAPGGALNREAYSLLWTENRDLYLKAGRFFLASGYRIEDDAAFIREVTGVNYNSSDTGLEVGWETNVGSTSLSITNGSNGGAETNDKKQYSLRTEFIQPQWRLGASVNFNDGDADQDRTIYALFSGMRVWEIDGLLELDVIDDKTDDQAARETVVYFAVNYEATKGHNLQLSLERYDPNDEIDEDQQTRTSLIWEYNPFEFTQIRTGFRVYDGIPQIDAQNREQWFLQLHSYF